jgi:SEC-C motif-containing protein
MRSRFAAFALGLGPYLVRTLAVGHEDRAQDPASLAQLLSRAKERQRFLGLTILEASPGAGEGDGAEVLFHARVFERGVDRSFVELSTFRREGGGFRYESGVMLPAERVPAGAVIDRASFLALVEAGR